MVSDTLITQAVLSDNMNVVLAKHVDFTMPLDGLIKVKQVLFSVTVPSDIKFGQLQGNDTMSFSCSRIRAP
jgi:hypothetical protein